MQNAIVIPKLIFFQFSSYNFKDEFLPLCILSTYNQKSCMWVFGDVFRLGWVGDVPAFRSTTFKDIFFPYTCEPALLLTSSHPLILSLSKPKQTPCI